MRRGLMAWDPAEVPASALADRLARLRADLAGKAHHVLERGVLRMQHIEFLLREITD